MGFLDFFTKAQKKIEDAQSQITSAPFKQSNAVRPKTKEDLPSKTAKQIIKMFYADYPEKPYVSNDRKAEWIEQAQMFPEQSIIPKSMMKRYADGLLPGHVYMLYWLKKYTNKKVPAYFEYKYGIDFEKEKSFLYANGFLNAVGKPSEQGERAITLHHEVINERHPKPMHEGNTEDGSVAIENHNRVIKEDFPDGVSIIPEADKQIIFFEFQEVNRIIKLAEQLAKIPVDLTINPKDLSFNPQHMFYEFHNFASGKGKTRYPLTMHYATYGRDNIDATQDYFGEISYSRDGKIASGRLIFWKRQQKRHRGFVVYIKTVNNTLLVSKVEELSAECGHIPLYKCQS